MWRYTQNVVQCHSFNDVGERKDITLYDYLNKFNVDILSFKMMDRLI